MDSSGFLRILEDLQWLVGMYALINDIIHVNRSIAGRQKATKLSTAFEYYFTTTWKVTVW